MSAINDAVFIVLGIISAGFGLKGFLLSSHFNVGGVTGVSMLLASVLGWPLSVSLPMINFPFVTRLELPKLRTEVHRVDPRAFIVQHQIDDASGGMLKRRPLH